MKTTIDTQAILDACNGVIGITCSDLARDLGCKRNTISMRLTRLVKQGRLIMVQRFSGGSPRYFSDPVFAAAAKFLNQELAANTRTDVLPKEAVTVTPHTVTVQVATRTGSVERIDRMAGLAPRDTFVARPGSMDFKSVPSLSPFTVGAVR